MLQPPPPPPLYVGFSGGADSLALLLVLRQLQLPVQAVHYHHRLRGCEADKDAAWCADFCRRQGLPFICRAMDVAGNRASGESLEAAARRMRLEQWRSLTVDGQAVALGHQAEDALENLLLRLARGSNVGGLTGLHPSREVAGVRLLRPLLRLRRQEIEEFLRGMGIVQWCEDRSNRDTRWRRNAVRRQWLPLMRRTLGGDHGLLRSLEALREDADFLEGAALEEVRDHPSPCLSRLRELHPALLPRVLRRYLRYALGYDIVVRHQALERLRRTFEQPTDRPRRIPLGQGVELWLHQDSLRVCERAMPQSEQVWNWQRQPSLAWDRGRWLLQAEQPSSAACARWLESASPREAWFPADRLPANLIVRNRRPGDQMAPFGHRSPRKVKDILSQAKVPAAWRDRLPLVVAGDVVIWVPGVRRSSFAVVDSADVTLVRFSCSSESSWR